jgi:hypothetical protein
VLKALLNEVRAKTLLLPNIKGLAFADIEIPIGLNQPNSPSWKAIILQALKRAENAQCFTYWHR